MLINTVPLVQCNDPYCLRIHMEFELQLSLFAKGVTGIFFSRIVSFATEWDRKSDVQFIFCHYIHLMLSSLSKMCSAIKRVTQSISFIN